MWDSTQEDQSGLLIVPTMTPLFPPCHSLAEMDILSVEKVSPYFGEKPDMFLFTQIKPRIRKKRRIVLLLREISNWYKGSVAMPGKQRGRL